MRILFIQYLQLGDVLMCTPAIALARRSFPGAHIAFLVDPRAYPLVEHNPNIDEFIVAPMRHESLGAQARRLWAIRQAHYDVVVDFLCKVRSAVVAVASGAPRRIAFARPWRRMFYTDACLPPKGVPYRALRKCWLLKPLSAEPPAHALPEIHTTPEDRAWAAQAWQDLKFGPDEKVVAVSPVSKFLWKRWPADCCASVCSWLARERGMRVLFTPGPREEFQIADVTRLLSDVNYAIAPVGTLRQFCALLSRCAFFVGSDGGQRHIAMAAGIPTVGIFGAIDARHWTPPDDPRHRVVQAAREKALTPEERNGLMATISPDRVIAEVTALLNAGPIAEPSTNTR